jgi:preprotein translocase subunit YajC
MNSFVFSLLMGAQGGTPAEGSNPIVSFLPLVAIIAIFYFLIIRPQNKKQKDTQKMLAALKKGDKIVTIGGIHGTIQSVKESTVIVRVDDTIKLEFSRSAISTVTAREEKEEKEDKKIEAPAEDDSDATEEKSE